MISTMINLEQIKRFLLVGDATDVQDLEWAVSEIERLQTERNDFLRELYEFRYQQGMSVEDLPPRPEINK